MKKIGEIAPWSFYRNDNAPELIDTDTKDTDLSEMSKDLMHRKL